MLLIEQRARYTATTSLTSVQKPVTLYRRWVDTAFSSIMAIKTDFDTSVPPHAPLRRYSGLFIMTAVQLNRRDHAITRPPISVRKRYCMPHTSPALCRVRTINSQHSSLVLSLSALIDNGAIRKAFSPARHGPYRTAVYKGLLRYCKWLDASTGGSRAVQLYPHVIMYYRSYK